jgi:hypothetical protein
MACPTATASRWASRDLDQWTQEVRLASRRRPPEVAGRRLYFDARHTDFYQRAYFLTAPGATPRNPNNWVRLHNINTSWAAFGQVSYERDRQADDHRRRCAHRDDSKKTACSRPPTPPPAPSPIPAAAT